MDPLFPGYDQASTRCRTNPSLTTHRTVRDRRQRLGLALGRKRLLAPSRSGASGSDDEGNNNISGHRLLFRRGESDTAASSNYVDEYPSRHVSAVFLNDTTLVAADEEFRIDAIRLPRLNNSVQTEDGEDRDNSSNVSQNRGTLVSDRLELPTDIVDKHRSRVALFPFHNGQALAAGIPGGEIQIFTTEHAFGAESSSVTIKNTGRSAGSNNPFLKCLARQGGPRRRYDRMDVGVGRSMDRSLYSMLTNPSYDRFKYLEELLDWNEGPYPPSRYTIYNAFPKRGGHSYRREEALFDFREIGAGGSLLTASLDPCLDAFALRLTDGRTLSSSKDSAATANLNFSKAQVCIDLKPLHKLPQRPSVIEDITSIAFVGENALASSHVSRDNVFDEQFTNVIKIWDIRKINPLKPEAATSKIIAAFPTEESYGIEAERSSCLISKSDTQMSNTTFVEHCDAMPGDNVVKYGIIKLTGSTVTNRLSIRTHDYEFPHHFHEMMVDANRFEVIHCHKSATPLRAFSRTMDFMASLERDYSVVQGEGGADICFFDLSQESVSNSKDEVTKKKKRTHDEMRNEVTNDKGRCAGRIAIDIKDKYDLACELSCLAVNDNGTALVGGSEEGDLFIWGH